MTSLHRHGEVNRAVVVRKRVLLLHYRKRLWVAELGLCFRVVRIRREKLCKKAVLSKFLYIFPCYHYYHHYK